MRELPSPKSVEEVLRETTLNIRVMEGTKLTVGPFEDEYSEAFHLAEIRSFHDLHLLGFIQNEIAEDDLLKAIQEDERVFRELSHQRSRIVESNSNCSCTEERARRAVEIPRRQIQDHLIELLQPLYRDILRADDPAVAHAYHHARSWMSRPNRTLLGIYKLNDIDIEDNATLTMTPTVQGLFANNITIGNNGRLRFTSGGVHVRCFNLNGPSLFDEKVIKEKYVFGLSREMRREN